ncbi:MAG: pyridoxal-phosphate dependent enzyme [Polyangiaceae bacterium]|nr:pyridoxal-phosphate dependent enzyme [Polyangiaceae bacterium]
MTRLVLGSFPTPVAPASLAGDGTATLFVKRDDQSSSLYGGNKVRKLEFLLGAAKDLGRSRLLTLGAVGSHHVVATALFGAQHGFEVEAVLVAQPATDHAATNLRVALAHGLSAVAAPAWAAAPALVIARLARMRRDTYFIPFGGSSVLGSLGFVEAAKELAAQIARGAMPEPDAVVLALGSGGTAAGLAAGFEKLGMRTRVVGVAISHPTAALAAMARSLAARTAAWMGMPLAARLAAARRIEVVRRWVGRGYGYSTRDGQAATAEATAIGLTLDPTYTAKAFACALQLAREASARRETILYWHTLSAAALEPLVDPSVGIPPNLIRLFRGADGDRFQVDARSRRGRGADRNSLLRL